MRSGKVMDAIGEHRRRRWSVSITTHKAAAPLSLENSQISRHSLAIIAGTSSSARGQIVRRKVKGEEVSGGAIDS